MNGIKNIIFVVLLLFVVVVLPSQAVEAKDIEDLEKSELVDSIKSVEQVKDALKRIFEEYDQCYIGSCYEDWQFKIAELVGALDTKVGEISIEGKTAKSELVISANDLKLFRLIWRNCHPTSYQYWQYDSVLHVSYMPTKEDDKKIRKMLNIKLRKKAQPPAPLGPRQQRGSGEPKR